MALPVSSLSGCGVLQIGENNFLPGFRSEFWKPVPRCAPMLVTIEDLMLNETRTEEIQAANFTALEAHLNKAAREMPTPMRVLAYHRSRFIEVWSRDGKRLMARYTPSGN